MRHLKLKEDGEVCANCGMYEADWEAAPECLEAMFGSIEEPMDSKIISIVHPTARENVAPQTMKMWLSRAAHPEDIQYILGVEKGWGFPPDWSCPPAEIAFSEKPRCLVNNANNAAKLATGKILVNVSGDFIPCEGWDRLLLDAVADSKYTYDDEFVIHTDDGSPNTEHLMTLPICSRARYKRLGYLLYPEYDGLYADSEFGEHARQDNCVIDAHHILIKHYHPAYGFGEWDPVYYHENRREALERGERIYTRRAHYGFFPPPEELL